MSKFQILNLTKSSDKPLITGHALSLAWHLSGLSMSSCFGKSVDGGGTCSEEHFRWGAQMLFPSFGGVAEERSGIINVINEPN